MNNFHQLEQILRESRKHIISPQEKTIFSIGGKGHYENPISDILAFFLNPYEEHGLKDLVLSSLNDSANLKLESLKLLSQPLRENATQNNKRIDIVLEFDKQVILIENKVRHVANNPFDLYENHFKEKFEDKQHVFILLSPKKEKSPNDKWIVLSYENLIDKIESKLGTYILKNSYNKWIVFLREFLLNLKQEYEAAKMEDDSFRFIEKYYQDICNLMPMKDVYLFEIQTYAKHRIALGANIEIDNVVCKLAGWQGKEKAKQTVYDIYPTSWEKILNISFSVKINGFFEIYVYFYGEEDPLAVNELLGLLDCGQYLPSYSKSECLQYFNTYECYSSKDLMDELERLASSLNRFSKLTVST
ncbi:MAG: PD-(D/E)XK nuclease family protein [Candidatus Thiothrix sulfatifontis]|nr:MAG: PD-(D/E)XK nuclease family protein [Candidatus Thiothrix sulfatifontis]